LPCTFIGFNKAAPVSSADVKIRRRISCFAFPRFGVGMRSGFKDKGSSLARYGFPRRPWEPEITMVAVQRMLAQETE